MFLLNSKYPSQFAPLDFLGAFIGIGIVTTIFFIIKYYIENHEELNAKYSTLFKGANSNIDQTHQVLNKYFPYYQSLNAHIKKKFLKRHEVFYAMKKFIPRQCEPNESLNILIAAAAVQITFGLNNFSLYQFNKILIYPNSYYNSIRKVHHNGEVNVKYRIIVFSAYHFLEGIKDYTDGRNLGLHEMSHALNIELFTKRNKEFIRRFNIWKISALEEMSNIKNSDNHFLRKYATKNIQEMFAVSTEYFFEKPQEFKDSFPILFKNLILVYNQNPLNKGNPLISYL